MNLKKEIKTVMKLRLSKRVNIILMILLFTYGVLVGTYQYPPYMTLRNIQNIIFQDGYENADLALFSKCNIDKISFIPNESTAIIGHAYGYPSKSNSMNDFAPAIKKNLSLKSIIFTGDVFAVPSEKWAQLKKLVNSLEIFVAPGNHDSLRPEVFKKVYLDSGIPNLTSISAALL